MTLFKVTLTSLCFLFLSTILFAQGALTSFSTGGHSVYHLQPATVNSSGNRVVISAAFDGAVLCHTPDGQLIWKNTVNTDFPYDLAVADIDNDGFDEVFIATAGGKVVAINHDGSHLWSFSPNHASKHPGPIFQVCPVKLSSGNWSVMAGGVEKNLYKIDGLTGQLQAAHAAGNVVRHVRKGEILGDGSESVAVATTSSGLTGNLALFLINPNTMSRSWTKTGLGVQQPNSGRRFFSMTIADMNSDGKDDIVLSTSYGDNGLLYGYNFAGTEILKSQPTSTQVESTPYRMNLLTTVKKSGSNEAFIFGQYGAILIIYNKNGSFNSTVECKYDLSNGAFDPVTNTYYIGSSPSGGDGIYALNLDHTGWKTAYQQLKPVGMLAEVEANLATLTQQVNSFVRPAYQRPVKNITVLGIGKPNGVNQPIIQFGSVRKRSEKYSNRTDLWSKFLDNRESYNLTREQIITECRTYENNKQYFALWAGHGRSVYMSPATMEAILQENFQYFQGFTFAEMEANTAHMKSIMTDIVAPLAEQSKAAGKVIHFRNKNIFWNGLCYTDTYRDVILNPNYKDVFVPALEETNNRTQELSLAGRVGLWMSGAYERWGCRVVTDDATFERMFEWSGQQVMSHYIRKMAMQASLGSDFFIVNHNQDGAARNAVVNNKLAPLYNLLAKGVIPIPEKEEILSISELCIGMKSPPNSFYISRGINGHTYNFPDVDQPPMVFDRLDCFWGGAPVADHDFSSYGYGVDRRMLNFLPKYPYGLVSIVPESLDLGESPYFKEMIRTDGQFFYDENGASVSAPAYKPTVIQKLEDAASKLPVRVEGDVAWTVIKINHEYIRILLIDPGYTDPSNREAVIHLQHVSGIEATDILSKEALTISGDRINVSVPAGVFRVIDIRVEPSTASVSSTEPKIFTCPTVSNGTFRFVNHSGASGKLDVFNLTGSKIFNMEVQPGESTIRLPENSKGVVLFSFTNNEGRYNLKHIIN